MKIKFITAYDSRCLSHHNFTTDSSKIRYRGNTERQDKTKHIYPGYLERKAELTIETLPPLGCTQQVELTL